MSRPTRPPGPPYPDEPYPATSPTPTSPTRDARQAAAAAAGRAASVHARRDRDRSSSRTRVPRTADPRQHGGGPPTGPEFAPAPPTRPRGPRPPPPPPGARATQPQAPSRDAPVQPTFTPSTRGGRHRRVAAPELHAPGRVLAGRRQAPGDRPAADRVLLARPGRVPAGAGAGGVRLRADRRPALHPGRSPGAAGRPGPPHQDPRAPGRRRAAVHRTAADGRRHVAEPGPVEQGDGVRHDRVPGNRVPAHVRAPGPSSARRRCRARTTTPTRCRTPCTTSCWAASSPRSWSRCWSGRPRRTRTGARGTRSGSSPSAWSRC